MEVELAHEQTGWIRVVGGGRVGLVVGIGESDNSLAHLFKVIVNGLAVLVVRNDEGVQTLSLAQNLHIIIFFVRHDMNNTRLVQMLNDGIGRCQKWSALCKN